MESRKRKSTGALLTAALLSTLATSAQAVIYTEAGDAGQTLATAQNAGTFSGTATGLTGISGTIGTATDADLYTLTISAATTLNVSAVGGVSSTQAPGQIDTSLFLFNSAGVPLIANDDQSGTNYQAAFTTSLAAGTYYLGISLSGNEPVNSANQTLFTVDQPTTNVRGPATGVNPTTESTFNGATYIAETGTYAINLSAVPEPSTTVALALGGVASLVLLRRVRRGQVV